MVSSRIVWTALACLAILSPAGGVAAQAPSDTPAPVASDAVVPIIPTSAFASWGSISGARISPDGSKLAFEALRDGTKSVLVHDADTRAFINGFNLSQSHTLNWIRWAGDNRLLVSLSDAGPFRRSRLFAYDIATGAMQPLTLPAAGFDGDNIVHVDPAGRFVLLSLIDGGFRPYDVYRFDLGGATAPAAIKVQSGRNDVSVWLADETGVIRIGLGYSRNRRMVLYYRRTGDEEFARVARMAADDERVQFWDFMGLRAGHDTGFSLSRPEGSDRQVVQEFDFSTGVPGRILHARPDADVQTMLLDANNELAAVVYATDQPGHEWVDPAMARHLSNLAVALPGSQVHITDQSRDGSRMLVVQSGPGDPGALYIFTPGQQRLDLFAEFRPQIDQEVLSTSEAFTFAARDGTPIRAFLTLPRGREARALPLIVNPHGGPFGVRNTLQYDDLTQLLANRGYAVVSANFRGSGGYGEAFEELGDGQIGRAMQDDLDDLVQHLVDQGVADRARVCMVGASYGGFAATWAVIRNPEIYRCAASWAGVMHFDSQLQHDRDYLYGNNRREWRVRVEGNDPNFDLDDVSPAVQVARLTRPLLLAHGRRDNSVPFSQFELMQSRADRADVAVETLILDNSGHSFASPEEEQLWYDRLLAFLDQHNPADPR